MALGGDQSGELRRVERLVAAVEMTSPMTGEERLTDWTLHIQ